MSRLAVELFCEPPLLRYKRIVPSIERSTFKNVRVSFETDLKRPSSIRSVSLSIVSDWSIVTVSTSLTRILMLSARNYTSRYTDLSLYFTGMMKADTII
jgi:hypothetical protein